MTAWWLDAASGAGQDSTALAGAERLSDGRVRVVGCWEWTPPHDLAAVLRQVRRVAGAVVWGDRYAAALVARLAAAVGIDYRQRRDDTSERYRRFAAMLLGGQVLLPPHRRLRDQLLALRSHARPGGRERIDHPPGGHDDLAAAAAGAVTVCLDATC